MKFFKFSVYSVTKNTPSVVQQLVVFSSQDLETGDMRGTSVT